jgi:hypothetical protein
LVLGAALAGALGTLGCESITGLDAFQLKSGRGDAGLGEACSDPSAFGGRGCYSCPATVASQLLNACTSADCTPFDNATRIPDYAPDAYGSGKGPRPLTPAAVAAAPATTPVSSSGSGTSGRLACAELSPRPVICTGRAH